MNIELITDWVEFIVYSFWFKKNNNNRSLLWRWININLLTNDRRLMSDAYNTLTVICFCCQYSGYHSSMTEIENTIFFKFFLN